MAATPRFLTLADVAEVLQTSSALVYALVRTGELPAIKIGGRGQWRVEASELEGYIKQRYAETKKFVAEHPYSDAEPDSESSHPDASGPPRRESPASPQTNR